MRYTLGISHEPYELADESVPSRVPPGFIVRADEDGLIDAIAADFYVHVQNCVRTFGDCHVALSGGRTPLGLYRRLMYDPAYRDLPWKKVHLWATSARAGGDWVEETVRGLIAEHADVPEAQAHFPGADPERYAYELRDHLRWRERGHDRLDYVLLGVDADGGVGGLAADDLPEPEDVDLVRFCAGGVGLSLGMLNASRFVGVMAVGVEKRGALSSRSGVLPELRPLAGELRFYVDADACPGG